MEAAAAKTKQPASKWGKKDQPVQGQNNTIGAGAESGRTDGVSRRASAEQCTDVKQAASKLGSKHSPGKVASSKNEAGSSMLKKPENGEATKICGCFGSRHKPLTNCLNCGRISCELEGYDFCHFCGFLIESHIDENNANFDSALAHKERLLEFDRTFAARTHIHDDQEDYFVTSTSMWSTQEEQSDARAMEEERHKNLHRRQKQKLNISF